MLILSYYKQFFNNRKKLIIKITKISSNTNY